MKFTPKKDLWLSILTWLPTLLLVVVAPLPILSGDMGLVGGSIFLVIMLGTAALMAWLWIGTYYIVDDDNLIVRIGPGKKVIPLDSITEVRPVRSAISSAAFSISRLEIKYDRFGWIHISPKEREAFAQLLQARCPNARIEG